MPFKVRHNRIGSIALMNWPGEYWPEEPTYNRFLFQRAIVRQYLVEALFFSFSEYSRALLLRPTKSRHTCMQVLSRIICCQYSSRLFLTLFQLLSSRILRFNFILPINSVHSVGFHIPLSALKCSTLTAFVDIFISICCDSYQNFLILSSLVIFVGWCMYLVNSEEIPVRFHD